ncbi:MAG TPA: AMP-binding protein [Ilumatobacter sp.]|nr:AMP-binding protein [Ilumatobacter sp.]
MSVLHQLRAGRIVARSILTIERPDRLPRSVKAMAPWGQTVAGLLAGAAARYPDRVGIHDDAGAITYEQLWQRARAVASSLRDEGLGPGASVGVLMRNHRDFVTASAAVAAVGADLVLLNTGFAAPQLADVVEHESISAVIHDDDFADVVAGCGAELLIDEQRVDGWARSGEIEPGAPAGRVIILTSGTTGRPKGAARTSDNSAIDGVAAVLDRIPLRAGDVQVIAAPLFHAWGFSHLLLGLSRCSTTVVRRRFEPEQTFELLADHRARVLVVVPVMLRRMMSVEPPLPATPDLRVIAASGSAIAGSLVTEVLDHFGPVLYNLYGSTEVAVATVADPDDLRSDPTTAGRVVFGVRVEILDERGDSVPDGRVGRIFVGGALKFDGYTNGGDKERIRGLLSSGDMGRFENGLLFVEGRDDDMIVSGGENVFPQEVEELLAAHPAVTEAAVVAVPDDEFGQRLAAFVVRRPGADLDADTVRSHVSGHLARHKVPRDVQFVDELPRNTTGKLLRRRLTQE